MGLKIVDAQQYEAEAYTKNQYFADYLETSDEWIRQRTGIESRHLSSISLEEMVQNTVQKLAVAPVKNKIKMVLTATISAESIMPSLAAMAHGAMALPEEVLSADINMACSGLVGGLIMAEAFLAEGEYAVVVGAEKLSTVTDFHDRSTAVLFGDGVSALLCQKTSSPIERCQGTILSEDLSLCRTHPYIKMDGRAIYKFATSILPKIIEELRPAGLDDIAHVVLHQANVRIVDSVAKKTGHRNKYFTNIDKVGNTSAASIGLCLADMQKEKLVKSDEKLLLLGFGGGLTYAGIIVEWG